MLWANPWVVQTSRDRVNWRYFSIFAKDCIGLHPINHTDSPFGHSRCVLIGIQAMTSCFYPNQADFLFCDIFRKGTDGIRATTDTGNHIVWQTTFFFQDLTFRFFTDHFLEFMHNGWVRVRANSRTQNVKGIQIRHPCSKGSINSVFQGLSPGFNRMNGCPHHFHAEDIQALAFHVFCPHVDITGHTELSCRSCCSYTVLTGSCFSNHARFAHAFSQEDLPQNVIQFMRT